MIIKNNPYKGYNYSLPDIAINVIKGLIIAFITTIIILSLTDLIYNKAISNNTLIFLLILLIFI